MPYIFNSFRSFERLRFPRVNSVRPKTESLGSQLGLFHICIFGTIEDKTKRYSDEMK